MSAIQPMEPYPKQLSKEEVNALPLDYFQGEIIYVDTKEDLQEALSVLWRYPVLGFDTETKPTFRKGQKHQVALLQLSTPESAYLISLKQLGLPRSLVELMASPDITKVGIAILDDIRGLQERRPFEAAGFVELQEIARDMGIEKTGARNLVGTFLGFRISKSQQTSNWERDDLSEAQQRYAATDAWICLEIYELLKEKGWLKE